MQTDTDTTEIEINRIKYVRKDTIKSAPEIDPEKYVIVRCETAGVFFGRLCDYNASAGIAVLSNCRRIWSWVDLREPISGAWPTPYMLAPLLFLAWGGVGLLLLLRRGRRGLCGLAMLYPWLLFWSELVSVRIQEPFVLYRSYLWLVGSLCFAAAVPLAALAAPKRRVLLACLVMVVYFGLSVERLRTFAHPLLLWDDAEKLVHGRTDLPGAARIYYNRGTELSKLQRWDAAMKDLQRAVQLQEDFPYAYGNLGACYLHAGQWAQARDMFSKAIAQRVQNQEPLEVRFYIGRASAYAQLQEPAKARADYQVACKVAGVECDK